MTGKRQFGTIRMLPSGAWQARYRDLDGRRHGRTFTTRGDASRYLSRAETDLERGEWRDPRLGRLTFGEWAKRAVLRLVTTLNIYGHLFPELEEALTDRLDATGRAAQPTPDASVTAMRDAPAAVSS